ncbi:MAG TPA: FIST N-terminal domain-containing protein [Candidatus Binatia bacterium]|nr:FIST N-terminal domain-containing protein [Candidatus Binatia bacterium]
MLRLASASSRGGPGDATADALARSVADRLGGAPARAVIFFATPHHGPGYGRIERALAAATGAEHVVGCSASAVVGADADIEAGPGVAALALAGDLEARRFFLPSLRGRAEETGRDVGRVAREIASEPRSIVLLADSYNVAPDELIAGIAAVAPDVALVGGGATEDGSLGLTTVVGRGASASNAVAGLALGGVRLRTAVASSCAIFGDWWTITSAQGNRVLALDGEPALGAFLARLPESLRDDLRTALRSTLAAVAAPVEAGEIAPPYVLRPFVGGDARTGALLVGDEVMAGMRLAIAVRDAQVAREALDDGVARLVSAGADLAGALYFNGLDRGESFYGIAELESAYLRRRLGERPLAGLTCSAGFAPLGGRNRFHQHAGVLVGLEPA